MSKAVTLGQLSGAVEVLLARAMQDDVIAAALPITLANMMARLAFCCQDPAQTLDALLAQFEADTRATFAAMPQAVANSIHQPLHS